MPVANKLTVLACGQSACDLHTGCIHSLNDWDLIHASQPFYRKLTRFIRRSFIRWLRLPLRAYLWEVRHGARLLWYGYDPKTWVNHSHVVSVIAADHLKQLAKYTNGCPGNWGCSQCRYGGNPWQCPCQPFERWKIALLDMAFFHEVHAGLLPDRPITKRFRGQTTMVQMPPSTEDLTPMERHRYRRGKFLYHKYYEGLWD